MQDLTILFGKEILALSPQELKVVTFIRTSANENIYWNSLKSLSFILNLNINVIRNTLNSLVEKGCLIQHYIIANENKLNQEAYYVTEYDGVNNNYYINSDFKKVENKILKKIQIKEIKYSKRINKEARTIKIQQVPNEKVNILTDEKQQQFKDIQALIKDKFNIEISDLETRAIYEDVSFNNGGRYNYKALIEKVDIVFDYTKNHEVDNIVGCIRTAVNQDWQVYKSKTKSKGKKSNERVYDYEQLEKELLSDW